MLDKANQGAGSVAFHAAATCLGQPGLHLRTAVHPCPPLSCRQCSLRVAWLSDQTGTGNDVTGIGILSSLIGMAELGVLAGTCGQRIERQAVAPDGERRSPHCCAICFA